MSEEFDRRGARPENTKAFAFNTKKIAGASMNELYRKDPNYS